MKSNILHIVDSLYPKFIFWFLFTLLCKPSIYSFHSYEHGFESGTNDHSFVSCNFGWGVATQPSNCNEDTGFHEVWQLTGAVPPFEVTGDVTANDAYLPLLWTDLGPGFYTYTITDSEGEECCLQFTIYELGFTITPYITDASCTGDNGMVEFDVLGGDPDYSYSLDNINFQSGNTFTDLMPGLYTVYVNDQSECDVDSLLFEIGIDNLIEVSASTLEESCVDNNDGQIIVNASNGAEPYSYSIDGVNFYPDNTFQNLPSGTYTITVMDNNNCIESIMVDVGLIPEIELEFLITDEFCDGANNGAIEITVNGGTPDYQYSIDGITFQISNIFTDLTAGIYSIYIIDSKGCNANASVSVSQESGPNVVGTSSNSTCLESADGSILCLGSGGTPDYSYSLNNIDFQSNTLFPNLMSGSYTIYIRDINGCSSSTEVDVLTDGALIIDAEITDVSCSSASDGSIEILLFNGVGPFSYSLDEINYQTENIFSNLPKGDYTIYVLDQSNCMGMLDVTISAEPSLTLTYTSTNTSCYGIADGTLNIQVTESELGPFNFSIDGSSFQTDPNFENLDAGEYQVFVVDQNNCVSDITVEVLSNPSIEIQSISQNETCDGLMDGLIQVSTMGGTSPFMFSIDGINYQSENVFNNIGSGVYLIEAIDINGCIDTLTSIVNSPILNIDPSTINESCVGMNDGSILLNITGDNDPFVYSIDGVNFGTDSLFSNLGGSTYWVYVMDSNNCLDSILINVDTESIHYEIELIHESCAGANDGQLIIHADSTLNYSYSIDNINFQSDTFFTNLEVGDFSLHIDNGFNCFRMDSFSINAGESFLIDAEIENNQCFGDSMGVIKLDPQSDNPPFNIEWVSGQSNGSSTDLNITNLEAGLYDITVVDNQGCVAYLQPTLVDPEPLSVTCDSLIHLTNQDSDDGIATFFIQGGTAPFQLFWENENSQNSGTELIPDVGFSSLENLPEGNYIINLIDSQGCLTSCTFIIVVPNCSLEISAEATNISCLGNDDGRIQITVSGADGIINYNWESGQNSGFINNLSAGIYTVTVSDEFNCIDSISIEILEGGSLSLIPSVSHISCFGKADGAITIKPLNQNDLLSFDWAHGSNDGEIYDLDSGLYELTVQDQNNCSEVLSFNILEPEEIIIQSSIEEILCFGEIGNISVDALPDSSDFQFLWEDGSMNSIYPVVAGNYSVTATDQQGCTASTTFMIDQAPPLDIQVVNINPPTSLNNDGSIEIFVDGGAPNYQIYWTNGSMTEQSTNLGYGSHTVIIEDANGCIDSLVFDFSPNPISFNIIVQNNVCFGLCEANISLDIEGGIQPYVVEWSEGLEGTFIDSLCNGNYSGIISDAGNTNISFGPITIDSPSELIIDGDVYHASCLDSYDGLIDLSIMGGTQSYDINWGDGSKGDSLLDVGPGIYYVDVLDANGCEQRDSFTIDDIQLLDIMIHPIHIHCDQEYGSIEIIGDNPNDYDFYLDGNLVIEENGIISNVSAGSHALSYAINASCIIDIDEIEILDHRFENAITNQSSFTLESGEVFQISLTVDSIILANEHFINWKSENQIDCITSNNNDQCILINGIATVNDEIEISIVDQYGCLQILLVTISINNIGDVFIPNIFSPQGIGEDATFTISFGYPIDNIEVFKVFDRWGNNVYAALNQTPENIVWWDGKYNETPVAQGVYIYYIIVKTVAGEDKVYTGDITVIR